MSCCQSTNLVGLRGFENGVWCRPSPIRTRLAFLHGFLEPIVEFRDEESDQNTHTGQYRSQPNLSLNIENHPGSMF